MSVHMSSFFNLCILVLVFTLDVGMLFHCFLYHAHNFAARGEHQNCEHIIIIYLLTAIGLSPGGSCYFTCIQNMKLVTTKFKSGGLHEKHVVVTWNVGNRLSICL